MVRRLSGSVSALLLAVTGLTQPIRLRIEGEVPFSPVELANAIAVRLPLADDGVEVVVRPGAPGTVQVAAWGKTRDIEVGDAKGAQAARRVALAILDLVTPEVEPPTLAPLVERPSRPSSEAPPFELGLVPTIGGGTNLQEVTIGGALDTSFRLAGPLRACASVGFAADTALPTIGNVTLSLQAIPVRVGLAWRGGGSSFELRLLAVAMPYFVDASAATMSVSHTGVTAGVGAALRYAMPLSPLFDLAALIGFDGFATRDDLRVHGVPAVATERMAFWVGIGWFWKP
jgi:hypothetical protein